LRQSTCGQNPSLGQAYSYVGFGPRSAIENGWKARRADMNECLKLATTMRLTSVRLWGLALRELRRPQHSRTRTEVASQLCSPFAPARARSWAPTRRSASPQLLML
jgi:hypothetical protein